MAAPTDKEMAFTEHLAELRNRLSKALAAAAVAAFFSFSYAERLFQLITAPLKNAIAAVQTSAGTTAAFKLIGTGPAEAFIVKLKVAVAAGVLIASPIIFYQLWCFISPALHSNERKFALPFVASSTVCFLLGVIFCFNAVLPFAYEFFLSEYVSIDVNPDLRIGEYLSFTVQMLVVFGVVFELPVLSYFLVRAGIIDYRWLIEKSRYAIVIIFIIAALLTPPDVLTQCLLAIPLTILYVICIGVAYAIRKEKTAAGSP